MMCFISKHQLPVGQHILDAHEPSILYNNVFGTEMRIILGSGILSENEAKIAEFYKKKIMYKLKCNCYINEGAVVAQSVQ
jgi:hypothetical protein